MQENEEIKKTGKKSDNAKKTSQKTVSSKKEKVEKTKENNTRKNNNSKANTAKIKPNTSNSTNKANEKKSTNSENKEKKRNSSTSKVAKKTSVKGNEKKKKESTKKEKKKDTVKAKEKKSDIKDKVTKEVKSTTKNVKKDVKKAETKTKNSKESAKKTENKANNSKENTKNTKTKDTKETTKKVEAKSSKDIVKKAESKKSSVKNIATENASKNKIDQVVVIEKIRDFISKVVAMQEEAKKEIVDERTKEKTSTKTSAKKESKTKEPKKEYIIEYYDLPYRYNETIVKILAQTPKKLFVYWDISDNDRNKYIETFGENFFETTYPVLLLYNEDKQYVKEVAINDFANSWYIDIDDPKTKYTIQLGRKFKNPINFSDTNKLNEKNIILKTDYLPFANSNLLETPNDHVLLEQLPEFIVFRNVKTNSEIRKDIRSLKDIFGNNYDVREFYEDQYKDELREGMFDMDNPSSNMTSSMFK